METLVSMPASAKNPDFAERSSLVAEKVRRRFDELDWTQQQLIEQASISRTHVQAILNNRGSASPDPNDRTYKPFNPTLDVIWKLADALGLEPAYLVDSTRPIEPSVHDKEPVGPHGRPDAV
ncbi:helix-turn-helix domain-containing protein [Nocardioides sp. YIM B13467]|uniref:helix-turn-helix domain-containing protein n=1 Tax=Nocardioides sp. YIM B13467 TaxID=3366294 RepID=UPI00366EA37A